MQSYKPACQLLMSALAIVPLYANAVEPVDSWQMTRLFEPTQKDLDREEKGSVMIYDGLTDKTIDKALDEHFERIEAMMFTRVIVTDDSGAPMRDELTGEIIIEDEGCD